MSIIARMNARRDRQDPTKDVTAAIVDSFKSGISTQYTPPPETLLRDALSVESYDRVADSRDMVSAFDDLESVLRTVCTNAKIKPTIAQEEAALLAGLYAQDPRRYLQRSVVQGAAKEEPGVLTTVIGCESVAEAMTERAGAYAAEAYDDRPNHDVAAYSMAYHVQAARQDPLAEMFFPTCVVTPDNVGFSVQLDLVYVIDDFKRKTNGESDLAAYNRRNLVDAYVDPTILRNDQTLMVPIWRKGGANDTTANFIPGLTDAVVTKKVDNVDTPTAPLRVNKEIGLVGLCATDAILAAGSLDYGDTIDSSVVMTRIYMKLVSGQTEEIVSFNTEPYPTSTFNAAVQGGGRELQLNFRARDLLVRYEPAANGLPEITRPGKMGSGNSSLIKTIVGDKIVRIGTSMSGHLIQDVGSCELNPGSVSVSSIQDATGAEITDAAIKALFDNATVVGYDLRCYRTNLNKRQRGQMLDFQTVRHLYTVPLLPPVTALRPLGTTETNDTMRIATLVSTTNLRTSAAAIKKLLEMRDVLADLVTSVDTRQTSPKVFGIASHLIKPQYLREELNIETSLDSLSTSERFQEMCMLVGNKLRDMARRLMIKSNYLAAANAVFNGAPPKPLVMVATDPYLAPLFNIIGDTRLMGDDFDVQVRQTINKDFTGRAIFAFGQTAALGSGVPDPMHFGAMGWKPEITYSIPMPRNGAINMELTVMPSFLHVVNLAIMGEIVISGVTSMIAGKSAIFTQEHPHWGGVTPA